MKITKFILNLLIVFAVTLVSACLVTLLWNLYIDNTGAVVDWKVAFTLALTMSLIISLERMRKK
ncbi:MAG: hypothetical protein Q8928_04885 [Bacteroidota bacterium]|nr:hypothetical protein [Bacteroidota bacterium]